MTQRINKITNNIHEVHYYYGLYRVITNPENEIHKKVFDMFMFGCSLKSNRDSVCTKMLAPVFNCIGENAYIYSFKKETLEKFVSLNQSNSEVKNKLEQLRALDNNIKINVAFAKFAPIGVDTIEDLEAVKKIMENKS